MEKKYLDLLTDRDRDLDLLEERDDLEDLEREEERLWLEPLCGDLDAEE